MNLTKKFNDYIVNWQEKLAKDEWYFNRFEDIYLDNIKSDEAFKLIDQGVDIVIQHIDDYEISLQALEILISLVNKSNTTEIPKSLNEAWDKIVQKISLFGDYHKRRVLELQMWYRKHSSIKE